MRKTWLNKGGGGLKTHTNLHKFKTNEAIIIEATNANAIKIIIALTPEDASELFLLIRLVLL